MQNLLKERALLEGGTYFNVETEKCGAYWRATLIRGNAVFTNFIDIFTTKSKMKVKIQFLNL